MEFNPAVSRTQQPWPVSPLSCWWFLTMERRSMQRMQPVSEPSWGPKEWYRHVVNVYEIIGSYLLCLRICSWEKLLSRSWYFFLSIRKNTHFSGVKFSMFCLGFCVTLRLHFGCQRRNCVLPQDTWKLPLLVSVTQNRGSSLCTQYSS